MKLNKYFIHYNVTIKTISARNPQGHAVPSALKVSDSQQESRAIFTVSLSEKAPTRLIREICEFQAVYL